MRKKIKVLKRQMYGFRNDEFFTLNAQRLFLIYTYLKCIFYKIISQKLCMIQIKVVTSQP